MLQKGQDTRLEKVLEVIKERQIRFPVATLAKDLKFSKGQVSSTLNGKIAMSDSFYDSFIKKYSKSSNNVSREINESEPSYTQKRQSLKNNTEGRKIPLYDAPAAAGLTQTEMTPIHAPAGTIDVGDLLHDSQAAIRIYGNSMIPNYPPGCVVGLAKCQSKFIEPGEVYVIETRDRRMLKRLYYKDDQTQSDFITCSSDNTMLFEGGSRHGKLAYPAFDLPKKEIINIFTVTGVIKRNANSIIINRK